MKWPWTPPGEAKSAGGWMTALAHLGEPRWGGRDAASLLRDGYGRNAVAHRCVDLIAQGVASLPLLTEHEGAARLIAEPNPDEDGEGFRERTAAHLLLVGDAYAEAVALAPGEAPSALYALPPDRMRALVDDQGWIEGWRLRTGRGERRLGREAVWRVSLLDPAGGTRGTSPLAAARQALDLHAAAADWAKALIDNSAKPSGALIYGRDGARLSDAQYDRLKDELETSYAGPRNAGRPLLLEGGLDWKPMGLTPAEMDFQEARNMAAREIALAFGVPPQILGIPGDATYSNYKEANIALWRSTIIPMAKRIAASLGRFLSAAFEERVAIRVDLEAATALSAEREALWRRLEAASFLDDAERRRLAGLPPRNGD